MSVFLCPRLDAVFAKLYQDHGIIGLAITVPKLAEGRSVSAIAGYPTEWQDIYHDFDLAKIDPVHLVDLPKRKLIAFEEFYNRDHKAFTGVQQELGVKIGATMQCRTRYAQLYTLCIFRDSDRFGSAEKQSIQHILDPIAERMRKKLEREQEHLLRAAQDLVDHS